LLQFFLNIRIFCRIRTRKKNLISQIFPIYFLSEKTLKLMYPFFLLWVLGYDYHNHFAILETGYGYIPRGQDSNVQSTTPHMILLEY